MALSLSSNFPTRQPAGFKNHTDQITLLLRKTFPWPPKPEPVITMTVFPVAPSSLLLGAAPTTSPQTGLAHPALQAPRPSSPGQTLHSIAPLLPFSSKHVLLPDVPVTVSPLP